MASGRARANHRDIGSEERSIVGGGDGSEAKGGQGCARDVREGRAAITAPLPLIAERQSVFVGGMYSEADDDIGRDADVGWLLSDIDGTSDTRRRRTHANHAALNGGGGGVGGNWIAGEGRSDLHVIAA